MVNDNFWNDQDFRTILKLVVFVLCIISLMIAVSIIFPDNNTSNSIQESESIIESMEQSNDSINTEIGQQESQINEIDNEIESLEQNRKNQKDSYGSFRYKKSADESVVELEFNLNSIRNEILNTTNNNTDK